MDVAAGLLAEEVESRLRSVTGSDDRLTATGSRIAPDQISARRAEPVRISVSSAAGKPDSLDPVGSRERVAV